MGHAEVVPFGKYKGQPVEILLADQDYCGWLSSQPWFRERFCNIYQTIINYGSEPQDTPEHNEMQASLLDDAKCLALAKLLYPHKDFGRGGIEVDEHDANMLRKFGDHFERTYVAPDVVARKFEDGGWDCTYQVETTDLCLVATSLPACSCGPCDHNHDDHGPDERFTPTFDQVDLARDRIRSLFGFARGHCSKSCPWGNHETAKWLLKTTSHYFYGTPTGTIRVECKPDLGDDFPTVLRQVVKYDAEYSDRRCVVVRRHAFERVTWAQVVEMFASSKVHLIHEADIPEGEPTEHKDT